MPLTVARKLKIKEGYTLLPINAPNEFGKSLGELPSAVTIYGKAKNFQQIHWFVKNKAQMEREVGTIFSLLKDDIVCWIYYPKGSSKIQTDLTRDKGWDALLKHKNLYWVNLISFNDTWSAFGVRLKTTADKKKEATPRQQPIFDYVDAKARTVRLPGDLEKQLRKAKNEKAFFDTLSFTNKKEYVEWIVTAKREETRAARVKESIERLGKGWKNPANR
ncbi:MAG TPA: YdeI/OmpD-associated family protein [Flavisolibacter sp.]|nr:YdeI/OmpD-associated family protein [Flavisolibacter sp.]